MNILASNIPNLQDVKPLLSILKGLKVGGELEWPSIFRALPESTHLYCTSVGDGVWGFDLYYCKVLIQKVTITKTGEDLVMVLGMDN